MNLQWGLKVSALLILAILLAQALVLILFGQPLICECGYVKLWEGVVLSSGNSQHLTDWYTFSHMIHGFLFYLGIWYLFPRMPFGMRLAIAVGIEAAWEITENTPLVINYYRQQALAQGYIGDSVINSLFDTLAMIAGFFFAARAPILATIALALGLELFVLYSIRDNLMLNIMNFIYIFPAIESWQAGG